MIAQLDGARLIGADIVPGNNVVVREFAVDAHAILGVVIDQVALLRE